MMHPDVTYWIPDSDSANYEEHTNQLVKEIAIAHAEDGEGLRLLRAFWETVFDTCGEGPYCIRYWTGSDGKLGVTVEADQGGE